MVSLAVDRRNILSGVTSINVLDYGASGDNSHDNTAIIQAVLDANPNADIYFPYGTYVCSGPIYLSDAANQRNFQGNLYGSHATLRFTNNGSASDTDANMQNGLVAYTRQVSTGGDTAGIKRVKIDGISVTGPTNGCGLRLCNSQQVSVRHGAFSTNRYGIVMECCNVIDVEGNYFNNSFNAGLGMIYSGDTTHIWYVDNANPTTNYFNDGIAVKNNLFICSVVGTLAHILDMGSCSECVRTFENNAYFNSPNTCAAFGYLGRNVSPSFIGGDWFEDVKYPIRILSDNATEAFYYAGNFPGVTTAQPNGTYAATALPNKLSFCGVFKGMFFSRAVDELNLTGLSAGPSETGQHFSTGCTGHHIVIQALTGLSLTDTGSFFNGTGGGVYITAIAQQYYRDLSRGMPPLVAAPASAAAAGTKGQMAFDTGFIYVCTALNTWKRIAIATW